MSHLLLSKVKWSRDDFVRDENDVGMILMNPKWKVLPSVAFVDGTSQVMTCKDHNNVSDYMMIHPCLWKHNIPAAQSDKIAQVFKQSLLIKTGKASKYSTEWQMLEQRGSIAGFDTCNHVEFRHFNKYSQLRFDVERRAIHNRFDMDDHLSVFCNNNIISEFQASDRREDADNFCSNKNP